MDNVFERGAWVRCYRVRIHAWNPNFFHDLASSIGHMLKIDDDTTNRLMFDYAQLLIKTVSLSEINGVQEIMVDGRTYEIRMVEDLESSIADDACFVEYEDDRE